MPHTTLTFGLEADTNYVDTFHPLRSSDSDRSIRRDLRPPHFTFPELHQHCMRRLDIVTLLKRVAIMVRQIPTTRDEILATGTIDPDFAKVLAENPVPSGSDYDLETIKMLSKAGQKNLQSSMEASRPSDINEAEMHITLPKDGSKCRVITCSLKSKDKTASSGPLVVLFHGGGHCVGAPEWELPTARKLAQSYDATVLIPSYRLAPEHPFPASINDSWEVLQIIAKETLVEGESSLFGRSLSASKGFIVGGVSAGANLTGALGHLARDQKLNPPLTGQFLSCGTYMAPHLVPQKYQAQYLSRLQNRQAPILDDELTALFHSAFKPDYSSPLYASFDQHDPSDSAGEVKNGHRDLPPAYFQTCGMDVSRDDALIYEKVLREECGISTRIDLYSGYPHCWWQLKPFAELPMTKRREQDTVDGIGWLIGADK